MQDVRFDVALVYYIRTGLSVPAFQTRRAQEGLTEAAHLVHQADAHALDVVDIERRILERESGCSQEGVQGEGRRTSRRKW